MQTLYWDDSHIAHNKVVAKILELLCQLVKFGYYDSQADMNGIIIPLLNLLDNDDDRQGIYINITDLC